MTLVVVASEWTAPLGTMLLQMQRLLPVQGLHTVSVPGCRCSLYVALYVHPKADYTLKVPGDPTWFKLNWGLDGPLVSLTVSAPVHGAL